MAGRKFYSNKVGTEVPSVDYVTYFVYTHTVCVCEGEEWLRESGAAMQSLFVLV